MFEIERVNSRQKRGKTIEVKMIFNGKMIAALGVNGSNVLFDFLETAFNFPARVIEVDGYSQKLGLYADYKVRYI
jgi:hypothetical protein